MAEVDIGINIDSKKAQKDLASFSKAASASIAGITNNVGKLAVGFAAVFGTKKLIDAASQQEASVQKLNTALALTGEFTEETSKSFQNFASELQANSTIGDELSLEMLALAKAMGATNDQAKQVVQAAADMSAITGTSLDSNVRNLAKSLGGVAGRLAEVEPNVRSLTKEQLLAGEAIDLVAKKYIGGAKSLTKTFSGAATQASNSFGDLLEKLGDYIIKNPIMINALSFAAAQFDKLGAFIESNRKSITEFIKNGLVTLVRFIPKLIRVVGNLVAGFKTIPAIFDFVVMKAAGFIKSLLNGFSHGFSTLLDIVIKGLAPIEKIFETTGSALEGLGVISSGTASSFTSAFSGLKNAQTNVVSFVEGVSSSFGNMEMAAKESFEQTVASAQSTKEGFDQAADSADAMADSLESTLNEADAASESLFQLSQKNKANAESAKLTTAELNKQAEAAKKLAEANKKTLEGQIASPLFSQAAEGTEKTFAGFALGIVKAFSEGAEGAKRIITNAGANLAETFLPGAGAVVGPLLGVLSQGKEATKQFVRDFADSFPILVEAIAESAPIFAEEIIKATPRIAAALTRSFVEGIVFNLKKITGQVKEFFKPLVLFIRDGLFGIVSGIGSAVVGIFTDFLPKIPQFLMSGVESLFDLLKDILLAPFRPIIAAIESLLGFKIEFPELPKIEINGDGFKKIVNNMLSALLFVPNKLIDLINGLKIPKVDVDFKVLGKRVNFTLIPEVDLIPGDFSKIEVPALARGGEIPEGFPNDTFPARLTSGENVVDRSTNDELKAFLRNQNGGQNVTIKLQVGEKQLADVMLNLNRQGFRTV